jgi:hypothetical protein
MFASSFGSCSVKIKGCNAIPSKLMGSFLVIDSLMYCYPTINYSFHGDDHEVFRLT